MMKSGGVPEETVIDFSSSIYDETQRLIRLVSDIMKISELDEMIYNLCDNAIKYNKQNGTVDIIINTLGKKINLTVKDIKIGIASNEQGRVFERFY